jgi:hypothetical protein
MILPYTPDGDQAISLSRILPLNEVTKVSLLEKSVPMKVAVHLAATEDISLFWENKGESKSERFLKLAQELRDGEPIRNLPVFAEGTLLGLKNDLAYRLAGRYRLSAMCSVEIENTAVVVSYAC